MKMTRPIYLIAADIKADWPKPYFGAKPYLEAMHDLNTINDKYGFDTARSIVLYFLSNASSWRSPDAKHIKAELKELLK
jgi:hypothetical protein